MSPFRYKGGNDKAKQQHQNRRQHHRRQLPRHFCERRRRHRRTERVADWNEPDIADSGRPIQLFFEKMRGGQQSGRRAKHPMERNVQKGECNAAQCTDDKRQYETDGFLPCPFLMQTETLPLPVPCTVEAGAYLSVLR